MNIDTILDKVIHLPTNSRSKLKKYFREVTFPKGHILLRADKVENSLYFIGKGIARAFTLGSDNEITFWFGREGDPVISMRSYVLGERAYEDIELLEDSILYEIRTQDLKRLFGEDIHIANWGRVFAEKELVRTEERFISRQLGTAQERYKKLLVEEPDLIQRVQLGHIASFLGITQVSLSRIRAGIQ